MKLLAETVPTKLGPFMLIDQESGLLIPALRPAVLTRTNFIVSRTAAGQVNVISADVPDEVTDEDFAKFWEDSRDKDTKIVDKELAVQSFLKSFAPVEVKTEVTPVVKPASK